MKKVDSSEHVVMVKGREYQWRAHRQPHWCTADGWKPLALDVEPTRDPQRALLIEFPFKIISRRSTTQRQRPFVAEKDIASATSAALRAGGERESRGKTFVFEFPDTTESRPSQSSS